MAYTNCESTISPDEKLCTATHCNNYIKTDTMKRVCYCKKWDGTTIPGCEPKGDSFPVSTNECHNRSTGDWLNISQDECEHKGADWHWDTCYCCCSCMAWNTEILVPGDLVKYVQEFQIDDEVMVASYNKNSKGLKWTKTNVTFSSGTTPGGDNTMLSVIYNDQDAIIVSNDHLFLMHDGNMKRADRLVPGQDNLIDYKGKEIEIKGVIAGKFTGGIHHISAPINKETGTIIDIDNHLICANGIVCGDYYLQIMQNSDQMKSKFSKDHDDLPVFGTERYLQKTSRLTTSKFQTILPGIKSNLVRRKNFIPHGTCTIYMPDDTQSYVTNEQAQIIYRNAPKSEPISKVNNAEIKYLFKLFKGFYPDINFDLDNENETPNLYAFNLNNQKNIVVTGQLLRTKCMHLEGLAVILSHGVGCFYGAPPANDKGYACVGQADIFGIVYVLQDVFFKEWKNITDNGISQVEELFGYIKNDSVTNNDDKCCNPSISCRIETFKAATSGRELPICAGGPTIGGLKVLNAEVKENTATCSLILTFNMKLSAYSAENPNNYSIKPEATVVKAEVDLQEQSKVVLTVRLPDKSKGKHKIKVSDVYAFDASTIDKQHNSAEFAIK